MRGGELRAVALAVRCGAAAVAATVALSGCTVTSTADDQPTPSVAARTSVDGTETWDLRTPPAAHEVGIPAGGDTAVYETDQPRPVLVRLPEGGTVTAQPVLVTFDNFAGVRSGSDAPTTMDLSTSPLPLDQAYETFVAGLRELGLPERTAQEWRDRVHARPTAGADEGLAVNASASIVQDYLKVTIAVRYSPVGDSAVVAWNLYWGPRATRG